jgi:hypothetical protein
MTRHECSIRAGTLNPLLVLAATILLHAQNAVPLAQYDAGRTNANLAEPWLNTSNVNANQFGMLFKRALDGYCYAHPLYVPNVSIPGVGLRNVVYVATLHNTVFAFDADDPNQSSPYWSVNLGPSIPFPPDVDLGYVQPEMGIMSTPAIDLGTSTLYVVATTQQGSNAAMYLNALDLATGVQKFGSPALIQAQVSGSLTGYDRNPGGTITWNPNTRMQRSALLVANGAVYLGFASYGAFYQYHGWVMAYSASNVQDQIAVFNTTLNGQQGGVWQSGEGLAVDSQGNVYLMSGNGTYNGTTDFGNSFIKLGPKLQVLDWFTPSNWSALFANDLDLGASGPVLLPNSTLLVGAGKQGVIYLLDSQNMGQLETSSSQPLQEFQATPACTGPTQCTEVHSTALWDVSPNAIFYIWGAGDVLRGFQLVGGQFGTSPVSQSAVTSAYPGSGITVSSLGTTAGTGIVWATTTQSSALVTIVPGTLHAFDATDLTNELWNSDQNSSRDSLGNLAKFAEPVVANGRVYVPTFSNQLDVYGLFPTAITVTTLPAGLSLAVDSSACTTPCNFQWTPGSTHSIEVAANPQAGATGIQYVYASWSDGMGQAHSITTPSSATTYTATFATQYFLTTAAGTGGLISPSSGWYTSSTVVSVSATASIGYTFSGFSGALSATTSPQNLTMTGPAMVTANFAASGDGVAPATPIQASPPNGATGISLNPALSWNAASGVTSYDVYFGTSPTPPLLTNTTAISYSTGVLALGTTYYWQVVAKNSAGSAGSAIWSFTTATSGFSMLHFVPVTPCRIADTRNANGPFGGPSIPASSSRNFTIPSSPCGIPANAAAYSLNLTVVPLGPLGFLSVWAAGQSQPSVSTLNSSDGRIKANAAIVPAGANGAITVFASNPTNVIVDINGYFISDPTNQLLAFYPLTPCRIADTRSGSGAFGAPSLAPSVVRSFPIQQSGCNVPANAQAYALNMTVVPSGPLGFLSAWPAGNPQPGSSTLNAPTGTVVANAAIVPAGSGGAIDVIATNTTDLLIDINGYFAPAGGVGGLSFYSVTPCRIMDTRGADGTFGGPILGAAQARSVPIPSSACNIPSTASAYSLNATVVPPAPLGFLSLWNTGGAQPSVSTLNASDGSIMANAAIVPAGTSGAINAFASNATQLILDINGYFAP